MCGCGGGCPACRQAGRASRFLALSSRYEALVRRYNDINSYLMSEEEMRRGRHEEARIEGVTLVREIDALIADCEAASAHVTLTCARDLKVLIGRRIFGLDNDIMRRGMEASYMGSMDKFDERELESIEAQIETLQKRRAEILSRPRDDYEPGTYLIAHRKTGQPPRLYWKDDDGQWWAGHAGVQVGWVAVRATLMDETCTIYAVESMVEVER